MKQKVYDGAKDTLEFLQGVEVRYWDDQYATELLIKFFPIVANQYIDFNLE